MTTNAPPFDTYRTIERLINSGGFKKEQAEAIAQAVNDGLAGGVATSADIANLRTEIRATIAELETRLTNQTWKIVLIGVGLGSGLTVYAINLILST